MKILEGNEISKDFLKFKRSLHINLCGLFNSNTILVEEQWWYYLTHKSEDERVHIFLGEINWKRYTTSGVRTRLLRSHSPEILPQCPRKYSKKGKEEYTTSGMKERKKRKKERKERKKEKQIDK